MNHNLVENDIKESDIMTLRFSHYEFVVASMEAIEMEIRAVEETMDRKFSYIISSTLAM